VNNFFPHKLAWIICAAAFLFQNSMLHLLMFFFSQLQINDQRFEDAEEEQESHEDGH
jgi:hypothetical protein